MDYLIVALVSCGVTLLGVHLHVKWASTGTLLGAPRVDTVERLEFSYRHDFSLLKDVSAHELLVALVDESPQAARMQRQKLEFIIRKARYVAFADVTFRFHKLEDNRGR